jgi:hypothetical protein
MQAMQETIEFCRSERVRRRRYLDELRAGSASTQAKQGHDAPIIDTTAETIETERQAIDVLDAMLARHPDGCGS